MGEEHRMRRARSMSGEGGEMRRKRQGPERVGMEREGFEEKPGKAYADEGDRAG